MKKILAIVIMLFAVTFANAAASYTDLRITEVYAGISGDDGTADWFEITNFGNTAYDISTDGALYYDDDSQDSGAMDIISGISVIAAGESVIVMIDTEAGNMAEFWNLSSSVQIGYADGSGLGNSGDGAALMSEEGDVISYAGYENDSTEYTWEWLTGAAADGSVAPTNSVLGVNGAIASNLTGDGVALIGSPGTTVPEPVTLTLLGAGAAAVLRRRK